MCLLTIKKKRANVGGPNRKYHRSKREETTVGRSGGGDIGQEVVPSEPSRVGVWERMEGGWAGVGSGRGRVVPSG